MQPATIQPYPPFLDDQNCRPLEKPIFQNLLEQVKRTVEDISKRQLQISARVYSLSAPCESVEEQHSHWKDESGKLKALLTGCSSDLNTLYEYLPLLDPTYAMQVLQEVDWLHERLPRLNDQIEELYHLVETAEYTNAHKLSKMAVKTCEDYSKDPKAQNQLTRCQKLFADTKAAMEQQVRRISQVPMMPHIQRQILQLHTDTLELFQHRMGQLLPSERAFLAEIDKALIEKNSQLVKPTYTKPDMSTQEQSYIATFAQEKINGPLNFRQISNSFTGWFTLHTAYLNIASSIKEMKLVAKGVQRLENDVSMTIKEFVQARPIDIDKIPPVENALQFLRYSLQEARRKLLQQSKSGEVHAGLYYADQLEKTFSELRKKIQFLKCLYRSNPREAITSRDKLLTYLAAATTSGTSLYLEMHALFDVAHYTRSLRALPSQAPADIQRFYTDLTTTTNRLIAKIGPLTLLKGLDMDTVFKMVVQQKRINEFEQVVDGSTWFRFPPDFKTFLIRECTRALFFHRNGLPGNAKLDCILFFLQTLPQYKNLYAETMKSDLQFQNVITCYNSRLYQLPLPEFFNCIAKLFTLAEKALSMPNERYLTVFIYSEACQLLDLSASLSENEHEPISHEIRAACAQIRELAKAKLEQVRQAAKFTFTPFPAGYADNIGKLAQIEARSSDEFLSILFSALTKAVYATGDEQTHIQDRLHAYFSVVSERPNHAIAHTVELKYLIANFIFRLEARHYELYGFEKNLIAGILVQYVKDPNLCAAFQQAESAHVMELRLYQHNSLTGVLKAIKEARGETGFDTWARGMSYFETFQKNKDNQYIAWLQELLQPQHPPLEPAYIHSLTKCLEAMKPTATNPRSL